MPGVSADTIRQALRDTAAGLSAGGLTLLSQNALIGYNVQAPSQNFFRDLQDDHPFLIVMPSPAQRFTPTTWHPDCEIKVFVWFGFERDNANDFIAIEQFLLALVEKWTNFTDLKATDTGTPLQIDIDKELTNPDIKPAVALYTMKLQFGGA